MILVQDRILIPGNTIKVISMNKGHHKIIQICQLYIAHQGFNKTKFHRELILIKFLKTRVILVV